MSSRPATELEQLAALHAEAEWLNFAKRSDALTWVAAWRQRDRWNARWAAEWQALLLRQQDRVHLEPVIRLGQKAWGKKALKKAQQGEEPSAAGIAAILASIEAQMGGTALVTSEAGAVYTKLAGYTGEDAGQYTLDALGLGKTFAWASVRDFPARELGVRGSKVITGHYDNHLPKLAQLVADKCNPAAPKTIGQLTREIQHEWPMIARRDALRVARTESASVWETVNYNAMQLNGVTRVEWLIATGPSIGTKVGPVCKECLAKAAAGPYVIDEMDTIPPEHPNCRCTLIPLRGEVWLPPAEPWAGAEVPLHTFPI